MDLLMPEMVDEGTLVSLQKAMYKDLRLASRKLKGKPVWFVAVGGLVLKDKKKVWLFVALKREAEAKAWMLKLKSQRPKVLTTGTCTIDSKDGKSVQVGFDKVKGNRKATLEVAQKAFKLDRVVTFDDPTLAAEPGPEAGGTAAAAATPAASAPPAAANANDAPAAIPTKTVNSAASALGIDASEVESLIAEATAAGMSADELAQVRKLLANPGAIEAEADKLLAELGGGAS